MTVAVKDAKEGSLDMRKSSFWVPRVSKISVRAEERSKSDSVCLACTAYCIIRDSKDRSKEEKRVRLRLAKMGGHDGIMCVSCVRYPALFH